MIDDLIHFTLKQWNRLTISVTDTEVERAKSLLKLQLGQLYESGNPVNDANLLGAEVLIKGSQLLFWVRLSRKLMQSQSKMLRLGPVRDYGTEICTAGTGQIEGLLDYMRIRSDMSMMRW